MFARLPYLLTAFATAALLSSCASLHMVAGPAGECLRNADALGAQERARALTVGKFSPEDAARHGEGMRNLARVSCAVLGVIVARMDSEIASGRITAAQAHDATSYGLDELLTAGLKLNMLAPATVAPGRAVKNAQGLAVQLGEQAGTFARPFIPDTAAGFRDAGWSEVIRIVQSDRDIPGAAALIEYSKLSLRPERTAGRGAP